MNSLEHPSKPLNDVPVAPPSPTGPTAQQQMEAALAAEPKVSAPVKKTYHPKRFMVLLGIFVGICLLAIATMVIITVLPMQQFKKAETPGAATNTPVDKTISAKQAIAHIKEYFKAEGSAKNGITLPVRATGKDFYTVIPDASSMVSIAGEVAPDKADSQLQSIIHSLEGDGFTLQTPGYEAETRNYVASFVRKETFCQVEDSSPTDTKQPHWLEVRCADMATYEAYAKAQEPLVRLYPPLSSTSVLYGFVGKPAAASSKTTGYQTAELPVSIVVDGTMTSGRKYAMYYQTPDGLWDYFTDRDTTAAVDCSQYATSDLQKAYLGAACRDASKGADSTVQTPSKKS